MATRTHTRFDAVGELLASIIIVIAGAAVIAVASLA
jgi:hypothetical protein